jgi:hypothetical protein
MSSIMSPQPEGGGLIGGTKTSGSAATPPHVATPPETVQAPRSQGTRFPHARPVAEHVATLLSTHELVPGEQSWF